MSEITGEELVFQHQLCVERDAALRRVEELERERDAALDQIDQMEQDRTAWDKDCSKELNRLAILTGFEFEDSDGYTAEVYGEHIELTLEQYKSQRDAALRDVATLREGLSKAWCDPLNLDTRESIRAAYSATTIAAEEYERRVKEPLESEINSTIELLREFGFHCPSGLNDGVRQALQWGLSNDGSIKTALKRIAELEKRIIGLRGGLMNTIKASGGVANPGITDEFMILGVPAEMAARKKSMDEAERRIQELEAWREMVLEAVNEIADTMAYRDEKIWIGEHEYRVSIADPSEKEGQFTEAKIHDLLITTPAAALDAVNREAAAEALFAAHKEICQYAVEHEYRTGEQWTWSDAATWCFNKAESIKAELRAGGSDE